MRIDEDRAGLAERLFAGRRELEVAARQRIIGNSSSVDSLETKEFRQAVSAAIGYGIEALVSAEEEPPPLPSILLSRARLAARDGEPLQAVIRRYLAGFAALGDYLFARAGREGADGGTAVRTLIADLACLTDRVIATVGSEYSRAVDSRPRTPGEQQAAIVARLLDDELLDPAGLSYDFDAVHVGLIAEGPAAREAVDRLISAFEAHRLLVELEGGSVWAWLGSSRDRDWDVILNCLLGDLPGDLTVAIGEPAASLGGWRLTHRQASAALPVVRAALQGPVRYRDVALPAAAHRDPLLRKSLEMLYVEPLGTRRDADTLRETLRAYLAVDRNASSAAALLHVDRRTVTSRIRAAEDFLGRPLSSCASDLNLALQLEHLDRAAEDRRH